MNEPTQNEEKVKVRLGKVDSICLYQVTEDELDILEKGSPSSLYLNFSLFLISSAVSFTASLVFTDITSLKVFTVFVLFTILGYILGILLFILWYRDFRSSSSISKKIRKRLEAESAPNKGDRDSVMPSIED